ncbi:MAG: D-glycero-beta-D-manno-heptose-7-phosphate kinase [Deltaproteobacteria bacterium]|nr:D-glycero-beta-D-manno-heptose-7-phosphate kinase [Deltaproteobacteria bacterium]MBW2392956.1 D-glycero-beta-D-manno-heptose-7-phosphate kinase [Deltaproteobacteria bacterium]
MARLDRRRLDKLVSGFARVRLLVVGDVMLDEYLWGEVDRVSPEAPVPVVHVTRESMALGGAGNVVRNAIAMGAVCRFCGVVGDDWAGDRVIDLLKDLGVEVLGMVREEGRPTTRKTRVEARSQQMLRFDRETEEPISGAASRALLAAVEAALPGSDGLVLEDYGKGLLHKRVLKGLMTRAESAGLPVTVDPKDHVASFRGASLVKPNQREVEQLTGIRIRTRDDLRRAVAKLRRSLGGSDVIVTRGADGMTIFEGDTPPVDVPIAHSEVYDVQGAGDTSIAALTLARLAGASLLEAAVVANAAAGVVVGKLGTATATPDEIREFLPAAADAARAGVRSS